MANENGQNGQTNLPDPGQAYQHLASQIEQRVFFHKLAQDGWSPRTREEAEALYQLGGELEALEQYAPVKQASLAQSPILRAKAAFDQYVQENFGNQTADVSRIKTAESLAQDPMTYNSVLVMLAQDAADAAAANQSQR